MFSFGHPHQYYSRLGNRRPVESVIDDLDAMLLGSHPIFHALSQRSHQQEKFWHHRIQLHGFEPDDIKLTVDDDNSKVKIFARHVDSRGEDSDIYESTRSVVIPEDVDVKHLKSRLHDNGVLILQAPFIIKEIPIEEKKNVGKELEILRKEDEGSSQIPVETESEDGVLIAQDSKDEFRLKVNMHSFSPEEINVSLKDNSIVVKAEKKEDGDEMNFSQFYVSEYSLPPEVDADKLSCVKNADGQLVISAPYQEQEAKTE